MLFRSNGVEAWPYNGASASTAKSADGVFRFKNKRAEAHWRLREALDPSTYEDGNCPLALPPDPLLEAELTATRWKLVGRNEVQIEEKDAIKLRIGRSPDRGDAVVMSWSEGERLAVRKAQMASLGGRLPQVKVGYANMKARR